MRSVATRDLENCCDGWASSNESDRRNRKGARFDGHTTVEVLDHDPKGRRLEGLLGVQVHVGPVMKVQFKDWRLKDLPAR
jgi:hypothetical protein